MNRSDLKALGPKPEPALRAYFATPAGQQTLASAPAADGQPMSVDTAVAALLEELPNFKGNQ